ESRPGIEAVDEIAAVEGVDGVFIGPSDLAAALGHLGNPGHPEVQEAIRHLYQRVKAQGKAVGILAPVAADARRYLDMGMHFVAVGTDLGVFKQATFALREAFPTQTEGRGNHGAMTQRTPASVPLYCRIHAAPRWCGRMTYASALMAAARRLLWRAALFLWMMFLSATRSITLVAFWNTSPAAALSPAAMAGRMCLMAVPSIDRRLELCLLRSTD